MNDQGLKKLLNKIDVLDATDLRTLAKHLWKKREFFKKTLDMITDGIVVINSDGEISYHNRTADQLLAINDTNQPNLLWKYIPKFASIFNASLTTTDFENSFYSKEIKVSYPHHAILSVTITCAPDYDDSEKMFVLRIVDVTEERKNLEKTLNDEKTSSIVLLASGVAHEIGNPLNAIALRLELIKRQLQKIKEIDERKKIQTSVEICLDELARLDGITKNFLHAVLPRRPNMSDVSIEKILNSVINLMAAEFKSLNVEVINNLGDLPIIAGDSDQLKQVFFNILKNSCEAISGAGTIVIDGTANDTDISITFTDNGSGISCEIFDKIFTPYFSTKTTGNGLGMMIVKRILTDHNATIDIASAQNMGTKITINFPRKDREMPLLKTEKSPR